MLHSSSKAAVFGGCLAVVTWLAQRLPVLTIPEQSIVTFVRHDVVDHSRCGDQAIAFTLSAERMLIQKPNTSLAPAACVATLVSRSASLVLHLLGLLLVLVTMACAVLNQRSATWVCAWLITHSG